MSNTYNADDDDVYGDDKITFILIIFISYLNIKSYTW